MGHIGFSLEQTEGSRFMMKPPQGSAYSFFSLDAIQIPIQTNTNPINRPTIQRSLVRYRFQFFQIRNPP
jgi:hypothetical protein